VLAEERACVHGAIEIVGTEAEQAEIEQRMDLGTTAERIELCDQMTELAIGVNQPEPRRTRFPCAPVRRRPK
jgi:hypothetical protein